MDVLVPRGSHIAHAAARWNHWARIYNVGVSPPGGYIDHYLSEVHTYGERVARTRLDQMLTSLISHPNTQILLNTGLLHLHRYGTIVDKLTTAHLQPVARQGILAIGVVHDAEDGEVRLIAVHARLRRPDPRSPREVNRIATTRTAFGTVLDFIVQYAINGTGRWILDKHDTPQNIEERFVVETIYAPAAGAFDPKRQ